MLAKDKFPFQILHVSNKYLAVNNVVYDITQSPKIEPCYLAMAEGFIAESLSGANFTRNIRKATLFDTPLLASNRAKRLIEFRITAKDYYCILTVAHLQGE